MNIRTIALTVSAPRDTVFNFLADVENLPKWAGGYCERLSLERGRWWALTADGEQVVDVETSSGTGVIDLRTGPLPERMNLTPIRVLALSARRTLVTLTVLESPGQAADAYERRYELLLAAANGLLRRFSGGEVHAPHVALQFAEAGLN
jgi:hypothetical protein